MSITSFFGNVKYWRNSKKYRLRKRLKYERHDRNDKIDSTALNIQLGIIHIQRIHPQDDN